MSEQGQDEDRAAKVAAAYGRLSGRGDRVTTEALRREAGVSMAVAHAWLKAHRAALSRELPTAPDLSGPMSEAVGLLWAAAYEQGVAAAEDAVSVHLASAQQDAEHLAEAVDRATRQQQQAETDAQAARTELERITRDYDELRTSYEQRGTQLQQQTDEAEAARREARDARDAQIRAESAADVLHDVLDRLRATDNKQGS